SYGAQAPTAERTVGSARIIAGSLTPKPGIREQNLLIADIGSLKTERPVSFHGLLMCMREFAARRAKMDAILRKNHMADAAASAAPKINNKKVPKDLWVNRGAAAARSRPLPSSGSPICPAFALAPAPPAPVPSVFGIIGQAAAAVATRFSFRLSALR